MWNRKLIMVKIDKEENIEEKVETGMETGIMIEIGAEIEAEIGTEEEVTAGITAEAGIIAEVIAEEDISRGVKVEVENKKKAQTMENIRKHTEEITRRNTLTIRIEDITTIENLKTEAKAEIGQAAKIE